MKKKAHLKLTAAQHRHLMKALAGDGLGDVHSLDDLKLYVEPGEFGGEGWWTGILRKTGRRVCEKAVCSL